jgi:hypothetical protein
VCVDIYICIYIYVCGYIYIYTYTYVCVCVCVCVCVHNAWRDRLARARDESCDFVLPTSMLFKLAVSMPKSRSRYSLKKVIQ